MEFTLERLLRAQASRRPDAPALTVGSSTLTWGELQTRAARMAHALAAQGAGPQDRVAVVSRNSSEYLELVFGAAMLGAVAVPINWRLPRPEAQAILDELDPAAVVTDPRVASTAAPGGAGVSPAPNGGADTNAAAGPDGDVLQLYTRGTTGPRRGVPLSNRNLGCLAEHAADAWNLDETSVNLVAMPLFAISGVGWALWGMWQGCHSVLVRDFDPVTVLEVMESRRVTNALFVPAMLGALAAVPGAAERDFSSLRTVCYGAAPIREPVLGRAMQVFRCDFVQLYGLTETAGPITQLGPEDHLQGRLLRSAGRPYPWVELRIADPATGAARSAGEVGEVWTRTPQRMRGYWRRPDATAAAITGDGWLRTGDLGYLDEDGYLFLTGRIAGAKERSWSSTR